MKGKKRRFEFFSFYDREGIARHLERQAAQGWLLEKIGNFGWVYKRIEPMACEFSVIYYPRASEFDPVADADLADFQDFCAREGWTFAASSAQMQVFWNAREDRIPLDTDPVFEVENIHAAAKKAWLPGQFVFLGLALLQLTVLGVRLAVNPLNVLCSASSLYSFFAWTVVLALSGVELVAYFNWYNGAAGAAQRGEFLSAGSRPVFQKVCLCLTAAGFALWMLSLFLGSSPVLTAAALATMAGVLLIVLLVNGVKQLMKRLRVPAEANRLLTILLAFVLSFSLTGLVSWSVLRLNGSGALDHIGNAPEPPLSAADLFDITSEAGQQTYHMEGSIFLAKHEYWQTGRLDGGSLLSAPFLHYTLYELRAAGLYGLCRDRLSRSWEARSRSPLVEAEGIRFYLEPVDPAPWGAVEAYRMARSGGGPLNHYLVCYRRYILEIEFEDVPTAAQMAAVGRKLG